jgi:hypothetical protein
VFLSVTLASPAPYEATGMARALPVRMREKHRLRNR